MTTLARYIDMIARAPEMEVSTATPPKGRGAMPRKPQSTFNPLGADKAIRSDDDAIVAAYKSAVSKVLKEGQEFKLTDEQILVTVRSVPGPTTEELEGKRINALLKATGVEHKAEVDISAKNIVAEHEAEAEKDAVNFPEAAFKTLRQMTKSAEFGKIGALVLRQNMLEDEHYGKDWMRAYPRIGYVEGKPGDDGRTPNRSERYAIPYVDSKGDKRSKQGSTVTALWSKTKEGKVQLDQIANLERAGTDDAFAASHFPNMGKRVRNDELNKWKLRHKLSVDTLRQAIHIEQVMQDLETAAPNVVVQVKYKRDANGNDTTELRNSPRPIIVYDKGNVDTQEEFSIRDFIRIKAFKAQVPDKQKDKGANVTQLRATQARKTQPRKGQGAVATSESTAVATGYKTMVNAQQALLLITGTLANYFDQGETQEDRRAYLKRCGDLQSLLTPKNASQEVLAFGTVVREMEQLFMPMAHRFSVLVEKQAEASEAQEDQGKKTA